MVFEYQTTVEKGETKDAAQVKLQKARETEKELIATGKIRPHRNDYTIVVSSDSKDIEQYT